jgi:pilus assembly protein CpaE
MSRNPKVIIIDQDPSSRAETQRMLALSGFAVMGAAGYGMEAITLAKETDPQVIVASLEEPIARSLQTIESVADVLPTVPIIAYSSISDPNTIRKAMQIGIKDYLVAPLKEEDLSRSIFTVLAQEERRQQRLTGEVEAQAFGTVLTIFGAKGGIGKTTIATNVAASLVQKTGQSVVLVDLDTRFGDVAILMDIPADRSIADLAMPDDQIDREAVQSCVYNHSSGVEILPAPIRPSEWQSIHPGHIEKTVAVLAATHDYVVLDTPGTFNDIVSRALEMSTIVLLIATMDLASLKDTILALEMLRSWSFPAEKVKVVVNHTNESHTDARVDIRRILGKDVFWSIPYDRNISQATQLGMPIVVAKPKSKASESFTELAYAVAGIRRRPKGMLERLGERIPVLGATSAAPSASPSTPPASEEEDSPPPMVEVTLKEMLD